MHAILRRLETGERWWAAQVAFAALALVLLSTAVSAARELCGLVAQAPVHEATPLEFVVAAFAVVCCWSGLACMIEGPGLFRLAPVPRALGVAVNGDQSDWAILPSTAKRDRAQKRGREAKTD
jgi:hypothetical protein